MQFLEPLRTTNDHRRMNTSDIRSCLPKINATILAPDFYIFGNMGYLLTAVSGRLEDVKAEN